MNAYGKKDYARFSDIIYKGIESLLLSERKRIEGISVSWDIADGGREWVVQFWHKDEDGKMNLLTQLDKDSDEGGNFLLATLLAKIRE